MRSDSVAFYRKLSAVEILLAEMCEQAGDDANIRQPLCDAHRSIGRAKKPLKALLCCQEAASNNVEGVG